jgi:hypothetical protein
MYCKECGNLLEESDLICKVCGANIREQRRQTASGVALAGVSADGRAEADFAFPRDDAEETNTFDEREASPSHETTEAGTELASESTDPEADTEPASESGPSEAADLESVSSEADMPEVPMSDDSLEDASPACDAPAAEGLPEFPAAEGSPEFPAAENIMEEGHRKPTFGEFRWNIHEFPNTELRRTEDIDFNWNMSPSSARFQEDSDDARIDGEEDAAADAEEHAVGADAEEISFDKLGDAFFALFEERETGARDAEAPVDFAAPDARDADGYIQDFLARETELPAEEGGEEIVAPAQALAEAGPEVFAPVLESSAETPGREHFFTFNNKN